MKACWETLMRAFRRLGWRYRRARRCTARTPVPHRVAAARKAIGKLWALEKAGRGDLLYGDQSGFCLQPTLFRCWQPPGPTLSLPAQAHGKRLNVVGFLRHGDGKLVHLAREGRLGAAEFIEAVEGRLLPALAERGRPAVLVLDNGPCHALAPGPGQARPVARPGLAPVVPAALLPPPQPHRDPLAHG